MSKSFEKSKAKQDCREKLIQLTKQHIPETKVITTLPSEKMLCVKTFKRTFPKASYIGIERDKDICNTINQNGIYTFNCDVREYIHSMTVPSPHIDMFFLDYYSFLHKGIIDDIAALIKNVNILHSGKPTILGLTLSKGIRVNKEETLEFLREYIHEDDEPENTIDLIGKALMVMMMEQDRKIFGCEMLHKKEYRTGQQMYFIVFKITV